MSEARYGEQELAESEAAVEVRRRLAARDPDQYEPLLAVALSNLSDSLLVMRRPARSLPPAEEAVLIFRRLAAADPYTYQSGLAASLISLGNVLFRLYRQPQALAPTEEAVDLLQSLDAAEPGSHLPALALARSNLIRYLEYLSRHEDPRPNGGRPHIGRLGATLLRFGEQRIVQRYSNEAFRRACLDGSDQPTGPSPDAGPSRRRLWGRRGGH